MTNVTVNASGAGSAASGGGMQVRDASTVSDCAGCHFTSNLGQGGVFVNGGSTLSLTNTVIDSSITQGLLANGAGTRVRLSGGSITNTRRDAMNQGGFGLNSQSEAAIICSGVTLNGNAAGNVLTSGGGSATGC